MGRSVRAGCAHGHHKIFPAGRKRPFQGPFLHFLGPVSCMFIDSRRPAGTTSCFHSFAGGDRKNKGRKAFSPVISRDRSRMIDTVPLAQGNTNDSSSDRGCMINTPTSGRPGKSLPSTDRTDRCIGHNTGIPLWVFGGILTRCVVKVEVGTILSCHAFRRSVCRRPTVPHTLSSDDVAERGAR